MEAEHQGSEPGTPEDGSEKVMVGEPLAPGGQNYLLKVGSEWIRNTARERKTKSHNVKIAKNVLHNTRADQCEVIAAVSDPTVAHGVGCVSGPTIPECAWKH
jgi:hypothetical protein